MRNSFCAVEQRAVAGGRRRLTLRELCTDERRCVFPHQFSLVDAVPHISMRIMSRRLYIHSAFGASFCWVGVLTGRGYGGLLQEFGNSPVRIQAFEMAVLSV